MHRYYTYHHPRLRFFLAFVLSVAWLITSGHATSTFPNPKPQGRSWEACATAISQISSQGDGTTTGSCMSCDPTYAKCSPKCQPLIDVFYRACDSVYTPPGNSYVSSMETLRKRIKKYFLILRRSVF